jgi:predicted GIY-YIG superfamily endonuclease
MAVDMTEGGLTVGVSADVLKRRANHQSGHVEAKYKLWPYLQTRILP